MRFGLRKPSRALTLNLMVIVFVIVLLVKEYAMREAVLCKQLNDAEAARKAEVPSHEGRGA